MSDPLPDNNPGQRLASGVLWIGGFRWAAQVISWLSTLVVIRLLAPEDYGILGIALAWIGVVSVVAEFGLGTALVALPSLEARQAAQLNSFAVGLGTSAAAISVAGSGLVADFFREPLLRQVLPALSLLFILEAARIVPLAVLARRLEYRRLAGVDFTRSIVSAGVVLTLAIAGWGYWALVMGNLAGQLVATTWTLRRYAAGWARPVFAELRLALEYSRHLLINRVAWQAYINADFLVAGRMFGTASLGFYTVARNLASLPGEKLGNVVTAASAPFFSSIQQDRSALRHYFLRVTETLSLVLHPVLFGFLLVADLAIPVVIGERWIPSIEPLRYLVAAAALQTVVGPVGQILNVTGNTRLSMWSAVLAMTLLVPGFVVGGYLGGINGVALAWLVVFPVTTILPLTIALRALGMTFAQYLSSWRRAAEGVVGMAAVVLLLRWALGRLTALPILVELGVGVLIGAATYAGILMARHGPFLRATAGALLRRPAVPKVAEVADDAP